VQVDQVEDECTGESTDESADGTEEIALPVGTLMRTIANQYFY